MFKFMRNKAVQGNGRSDSPVSLLARIASLSGVTQASSATVSTLSPVLLASLGLGSNPRSAVRLSVLLVRQACLNRVVVLSSMLSLASLHTLLVLHSRLF